MPYRSTTLGKNQMQSGGTDLNQLISGMQPVLAEDVFVFTTFKVGEAIGHFDPIMMFKEREGTTLILTQKVAEKAGLDFEFPCKMITLSVHSALDAVGFLAKITTRLAALNMGVNPVSGFYHDHLLIPVDKAELAMQELQSMIDEGPS